MARCKHTPGRHDDGRDRRFSAAVQGAFALLCGAAADLRGSVRGVRHTLPAPARRLAVHAAAPGLRQPRVPPPSLAAHR
ncbi:MAG TPA: hypothetical protein VH599_11745 [Ktedonobacterales bacterium]